MSGLNFIGKAMAEGAAGLRRAEDKRVEDERKATEERRKEETHSANMKTSGLHQAGMELANEGTGLRNQQAKNELNDYDANSELRSKQREATSASLDNQLASERWKSRFGDDLRNSELATAKYNQRAAELTQRIREMEAELARSGHDTAVKAKHEAAIRNLRQQRQVEFHEMGSFVIGLMHTRGGEAAAAAWNEMLPNVEEGSRPAANMVVAKDDAGQPVYQLVDDEGLVVTRGGQPQVFSQREMDLVASMYTDPKGNQWVPDPDDVGDEVLMTMVNGSPQPVIDWRSGEPVTRRSGKISIPGVPGGVKPEDIGRLYKEYIEGGKFKDAAMMAPGPDAFVAFGYSAEAVLAEAPRAIAAATGQEVPKHLVTAKLIEMAGPMPTEGGPWTPVAERGQVYWLGRDPKTGKRVVAAPPSSGNSDASEKPVAPSEKTAPVSGGSDMVRRGRAGADEQSPDDAMAPAAGGVDQMNAALDAGEEAAPAVAKPPAIEDFRKTNVATEEGALALLNSFRGVTRSASGKTVKPEEMTVEQAKAITDWWRLNKNAWSPAVRTLQKTSGKAIASDDMTAAAKALVAAAQQKMAGR